MAGCAFKRGGHRWKLVPKPQSVEASARTGRVGTAIRACRRSTLGGPPTIHPPHSESEHTESDRDCDEGLLQNCCARAGEDTRHDEVRKCAASDAREQASVAAIFVRLGAALSRIAVLGHTVSGDADDNAEHNRPEV